MIIDMRLKLGFRKVRNSVLAFIFLAAAFSGGYLLGVRGYRAEIDRAWKINFNRAVPPNKNIDFSLFWQVWDTLAAKYYDKSKLIPSQMVYGAISGMVSAAGDPYTIYLPPNQNKIVNEDLSGSFEGVGIEIGYKNTRLAVVAPLPGSPAQKAGLKPGDYIVHIKDAKKNIDLDSASLAISQAVDYIRGPAGSTVELTIMRDGNSKPITAALVRAKLDVPSVTLTWVGTGGKIADVKVAKFDSKTTEEWGKVAAQINARCQASSAKCNGIIIDLRNNPGGYMQSAVDLASDFMDIGTVAVVQQNGDGSRQEYKTEKLPGLANYRVVVLINGGSASASEILAGALRDDRGIKLIGEKSFGKGTIQEPIEIAGGSGLHVTTAKWLTPAGTWVQEKGLTPDVSIVLEDASEEDLQLNEAVKMLEG
jgi:carboxyl-terminal processing protease